jgi:hypothetical protein
MACRTNFPSDLKKKKLQEYELCAYQYDMKVMCLSFHDKRLVTMLSTFFGPQTQWTPGYRKEQLVQFEKLTVILEYTKCVGGMDRADQYCGCYGFTGRSYKWRKKLFFWLMEVAVMNSYILYSLDKTESGEKLQTRLSHRMRNLIVQLGGNVRNRNSRKRGRPSSEGKDCMVCSRQNEKEGRRGTIFYCETCKGRPGLHPGACFKKYHTQKDYKQKHFNYFGERRSVVVKALCYKLEGCMFDTCCDFFKFTQSFRLH